MVADVPTRSQINKAGRTARRYYVGRLPFDDTLGGALSVIQAYRAAHQYPLGKANMGLRSILRTVGCGGVVAQRLKRFWTILNKLEREPTMALSHMQDIGGCRAVLFSIADVRAVEHRLRKNRTAQGYADYITEPRSTGYRGVHVIVYYEDHGGEDRAIEVQLRTQAMHEWAITVERLGGRIQADLKSGLGPPQVLDLLGAASEAMAIEEQGGIVSQELLEQMKKLRAAAVPYLEKRS